MHVPSLKSVLLALALLGLVVPTGAALTMEGPDTPFQGNDVVLAPYDGPNGEYASVGTDGNLSVDLSDPGVNNGGETLVERVFVIENRGDRKTQVWVTHDATESVVLYESATRGGVRDESAIDRRAIQGASNRVTLQPGEHIVASIYVDTRSNDTTVGDTLLNEISLHVRQSEAERNGSVGGGQGAPVGEEAPPPNTTGVEAELDTPDTVVNETGTGDGNESGDGEQFTIEEVDPDSIPEDPNPGSEPQPKAVITDENNAESRSEDGQLTAQGADKVTTTDEPVSLVGYRSTVNRTSGVEIDRRIVKAADITPPPGRENQPGTVRMEVPRDRLISSPENAQMGHLTENGWELLETEVVAKNEDTVVYEARTPGFSPFAIFDGPDVEYEWTLPNGTTVQGPEVRSSFDEPGIYNVTLRITDAFGNSDTTEYRILVNDEPDITIEPEDSVVPGEPTTLRANVSDEVGNVTVTWQLPNGTQAQGQTVNYTFTNGTFDVSATAEDEFGEMATAQTTITTERSLFGVVTGSGFPVLAWLLAIGLVVFLSAVALRLWRSGLPALPGWITIPSRDRGRPRITAFENPSWDPRRGRFEIGRLRVEDPNEDLDTVEIGIRTPDGIEVARRTVDFGGTGVYEVSPLFIPGVPTREVDPTRKYNVRIRAADTEDNEDTAVSALRFLPTFDAQPGVKHGVPAD